MKLHLTVFSLLFLTFQLWGQDIADINDININVFYWDSITNKAQPVYRELEVVGSEEYFSNPEAFDIEVGIQSPGNTNYFMEIYIEELIGPRPEMNTNCKATTLTDSIWVLHQVLYSGQASMPLKVEGIKYQTAYYLSSSVYTKYGFRIVALLSRVRGSDNCLIQRKTFHSID